MSNEITREDLMAGMKRGEKIKIKAKEKGVPIWWLAKARNMNDGNFSRLLRDLSEQEFDKLSDLIDKLSADR